jgi:hypothetical protein
MMEIPLVAIPKKILSVYRKRLLNPPFDTQKIKAAVL